MRARLREPTPDALHRTDAAGSPDDTDRLEVLSERNGRQPEPIQLSLDLADQSPARTLGAEVGPNVELPSATATHRRRCWTFGAG